MTESPHDDLVAKEGTARGMKTLLEKLDTTMRALDSKTSDIRVDFIEGRTFTSGAKLALNSNSGVMQLKNPVGSGKIVTLQRVLIECTLDGDLTFRVDSTINLGTVRAAFRQNRTVSTPAPVAVVTSSVGDIGVISTGGTDLPMVVQIKSAHPMHLDFPVALGPGQAITSVCTLGALASANLYMNVTWSEDLIPV